ncbi:MAG TPA: condensation domain-containing protein [Streptomyces sp.]|nr:condensation domain-containing protein [Streptomyces sp.]
MTVPRIPHAPVSVVVTPGPPPYATPWDLDLRGPLDAAALERLLDELAPGEPGPPAWRHRLLRHGPDHHTLRFCAPHGTPAVLVPGHVADRLTGPPPADRPLTPAQYAALAHGAADRYEAVLLGPGPLPGPDRLRAALRAVAAAHPQLHARPGPADGRPAPADPDGHGTDPVTEGEFTDEDGFTALLRRAAAPLDPHTGLQLRALCARDRRPDGPRADRLAVIAHALAVDATSWQILLDDLTAALGTTGPDGAPATAGRAPGRPRARGRAAPDGLADWTAGLRELAHDFAETQHWGQVAELRSRTAGADARSTTGRDAGERRRTGFVLDAQLTERVTQGLARRLALTTGQVLTGVFALALAQWEGTDEAGFDVRSDPRAGHQGLRRYVGRLTEPYPVRLAVDTARDPLGRLTAMAGDLAASAGRAEGGAGFGACREWSPDPALRRALRELPPARACLVLDDTGGPRPLDAPAHPLQVRARVTDGCLHIAIDRSAAHLDDTAAAALEDTLRALLKELADAPAAPLPLAFRATPQQAALYRGGDARPGTGHHVEQLVWAWHGPLDTRRFTTSWQSVFDRETVLRTAFTGGPEPLLTVHERVTPEITRRVVRDDDWPALVERDRLRGFDLGRPGALRLTLVETEPSASGGGAAPARVLVTYHRALLDTWSVHLLLREFYRAYLDGGTLPGGERRPDLRDYTAWVAAQDPGPARGFWSASAPPDGAASRPGRFTRNTGLTGTGRAQVRLDPVDTRRLAHWAGTWGTAESSVLQAVWALLIHWSSGAAGAGPVCFAVTVSGRGIPLDGAARLPGPLRNPLPVSVEVDPEDTVPDLLRTLRDRALEMAAYEWVPAEWIRAWSRGGADADTVVVFEDPPHPVDGLEAELASRGLRADFSHTLPARSGPPVGLLAHHDGAGGLVLTGVHDRACLDEDEAAELLAQCALLLRALPLTAGESTTVGEVLELLRGSAPQRAAGAPAEGRRPDTPLVTLRPARHAGAGRICLIPPPGAPDSCYDVLARGYRGPQELLLLPAGADTDRVGPELDAFGAGTPVLLAGFSGAGVPACEIARRIASDGGRPPRVVLAGACADEQERARDLARALERAAGE